jgi:WD40 repeat protein
MRRTPTLLNEDRRGSSERLALGKALSRRRFLVLTAVSLIATTCQSAPQSRPSGPVTRASPMTLPTGRLQAITLDNARRLTSLATLKINGQALAVGWAKGGTILGVGNTASEIEVWDVSTLKQVAVLKGHTDQVNRVRWSPDGSLFASASSDGTVRIWENRQRTPLLTFQRPTHTMDNPALCVAWAPDGKRVVAGYGNGAVEIWDLQTRQGRLLEGQQANDIRTKAVWGVAWAPDGRRIISPRYDGIIHVWNADSGTHLTMLHSDDLPNDVAWSPDGQLLASSSDKGTVQVWEPRTFKNILTLQGRGYVGWVYPIAWSPDERLLAGGSEQGSVEVWEVSSGQELTALQGHAFKVWDTAWAPDGKLIASAGKDGTVHLWGVSG